MRHTLTAAAALLLATSALSSHAFAADCSRAAGSLPDPSAPAGAENREIPIRHIIVIMQENRSFDSYLGRLNEFGYDGEVDGVTPDMWNFDSKGQKHYVYHEKSLCSIDGDHTWNGEHASWNHGLNDGYVIRNDDDPRIMGYYEPSEIPYYYALANRFAIGDRYFASVLAMSNPNHHFMFAATAFGHTQNDHPPLHGWNQKTIFDELDQYGVSWKYYHPPFTNYVGEYAVAHRDKKKLVGISQFKKDLRHGDLPDVAFVASSGFLQDEHPVADIHIGEAWVSKRIGELLKSPYWRDSVVFFTYDEDGGLYDHVAPPEACVPDSIEPTLKAGWYPGHYDRYGHRVPFIAVSPYAKRHYVSHVVYDHTSVLKFIETKYNLPALTARDANADPMLDLFDFDHPDPWVPRLPHVRVEAGKVAACLVDNIPGYLKLLGEIITGND